MQVQIVFLVFLPILISSSFICDRGSVPNMSNQEIYEKTVAMCGDTYNTKPDRSRLQECCRRGGCSDEFFKKHMCK